ncbi:hypothetical protein AAMO2058_000834700 [Amorphochlora amoebiformis]
MSEQDGQRTIQDAIRKIMRDNKLSHDEKKEKIQEIYRKSNPMLKLCASNETGDSVPTYQNEEKKILGCKHYKRKCKLLCPDCNKLFTCRHCHAATEKHPFRRKQVSTMLCMCCSELQPVAQYCRKCKENMARYYCGTCKFFDDEPERDIYHCEKCGICRRGKPDDYFHCDNCGSCVSIDIQAEHKCFRNSISADCPVCGDYMFTSTKLVRFMQCGHCIHSSCYKEYARHHYTCPICRKSLANMSSLFSHIERMLQTQEMPPEFKDVTAEIYCNDCEKKSTAPYHFVYHKCNPCGSFNTQLLRKVGPQEKKTNS